MQKTLHREIQKAPIGNETTGVISNAKNYATDDDMKNGPQIVTVRTLKITLIIMML